ncbi:hypothetical protein XENOCAPTIV_008043, partial [Xenoophorus captivus]
VNSSLASSIRRRSLKNDDEAVVDRGGTRSQQRANFEQEDFEGNKKRKAASCCCCCRVHPLCPNNCCFPSLQLFMLLREEQSRRQELWVSSVCISNVMITQRITKRLNKDTSGAEYIRMTKDEFSFLSLQNGITIKASEASAQLVFELLLIVKQSVLHLTIIPLDHLCMEVITPCYG